MSVIVSPGVYSRERDFSLYAPSLATSIFAVVGTASKGPTDVPTQITDEGSLVNTFGEPSADHFGLQAAIRYLREGRRLVFVRVATYDQTAEGVILADDEMTAAAEVSAVYSGSWGDNITVTASENQYDSDLHDIVVHYNGYPVETYVGLLLGTANVASDNYWVTRINGVSQYIVLSNVNDDEDALHTAPNALSGGEDGAPADIGDVVGSVGAPPAVPPSGLQTLRDPEAIDVNLLAVPGYINATVINAGIDLCETRGDCMVLLSPPQNMSVQQAVAWHNGTSALPDQPEAALNSSYAALYYPWLRVHDGYSNTEMWVPSEGHIARVMAYTDLVADPWQAAAGLRRGLLRDVLEVEHSATQGERDYMYSGGNAVNPIVNKPGQGVVVWGQRTLLRATTALDRVNVRRMVLYLRKVVATSVAYLVFEPNERSTWQSFINLVSPICRSIQSRGGIYDYRVICDETTNDPNTNEMQGKILVQPTKTAEIITIDFTLLPTGARFDEGI